MVVVELVSPRSPQQTLDEYLTETKAKFEQTLGFQGLHPDTSLRLWTEVLHTFEPNQVRR